MNGSALPSSVVIPAPLWHAPSSVLISGGKDAIWRYVRGGYECQDLAHEPLVNSPRELAMQQKQPDASGLAFKINNRLPGSTSGVIWVWGVYTYIVEEFWFPPYD